MKLNLKKPLVVFDLETTGLDMVKDRIIQMSYIKVMPDGSETRKNLYVNPGMPIPEEVVALTGISDEEANAEKKRRKKNADFIVLNSTRNAGTTFRTDDNQITIISEKGKKEYEKKPKTEVARDIIDELARML